MVGKENEPFLLSFGNSLRAILTSGGHPPKNICKVMRIHPFLGLKGCSKLSMAKENLPKKTKSFPLPSPKKLKKIPRILRICRILRRLKNPPNRKLLRFASHGSNGRLFITRICLQCWWWVARPRNTRNCWCPFWDGEKHHTFKGCWGTSTG